MLTTKLQAVIMIAAEVMIVMVTVLIVKVKMILSPESMQLSVSHPIMLTKSIKMGKMRKRR